MTAVLDWSAVSAIANLIAAIGVTGTVVYLALQIRENTRATRSQTYQQATTALAEMAAIIGSDRSVSRVFRIGMSTPDLLTEDEEVQFGYLCVSLFRRFENLYFQYRAGLIDADLWTGQRDNALWFFYRPGFQAWWKERKFSFSPNFREFLDRSTQSEIASPGTRQI
jgi:hypothetical protein